MSRFLAIWTVLMAVQSVGAADVVRLSPEELARAGVETSAAQEADFSSRLRAVGQVVRSPGSTLTLKTIAGGRVEALQVAPGDSVTTGETVVTLHSHELLTMQSDLLLAVDQVKVTEQRLAAGHELLAVDGISQLDLQRREQEALSARLRSDILREEILDHGFSESSLDRVLAGNGLDPHLPVTSPVDGVVLEVMVQEQEWVQPYAPLLVVGDPARIELDLQLAPDQATTIAVGDLVEFEPVGRGGAPGRATVITRVPQVDPSTRTVRIRARIDSGTQACFPGAFVDAMVSHGAVRRSLAIPQSAVISIAGRDSVFVATGGNEFSVRTVDLGQRDGERFEVVGGLEPGEHVAIAGVFFLKSKLVKGDGGED